MTWRLACHLYVTLAVLLSLATAAQAYLIDGVAAALPTRYSPVLATLLLGALAVTYTGAALHAASRSGTPVF